MSTAPRPPDRAFEPDSNLPAGANADAVRRAAERLSDAHGVLSSVLAASAAQSGGSSIGGGRIAPLLEVARRHRGAPLVLDPIANDLLRALLGDFFEPNGSRMEPVWISVAQFVARSLWDQPATRARLDDIWRMLGELAEREPD